MWKPFSSAGLILLYKHRHEKFWRKECGYRQKKVSIKGTLNQVSYGKESKQVWMIVESIQ